MTIEKLNKTYVNNQTKLNAEDFQENADKIDELVDFSNSVIESGTNSSGSYVKYSDGTMVCYGNIEFNIGTMTQRSPFWQYQDDDLSISFAKPFVSKPIVTGTVVAGNYASLLYVINCVQEKITQINVLTLSDASNQKTNINYTAIGKWK